MNHSLLSDAINSVTAGALIGLSFGLSGTGGIGVDQFDKWAAIAISLAAFAVGFYQLRLNTRKERIERENRRLEELVEVAFQLAQRIEDVVQLISAFSWIQSYRFLFRPERFDEEVVAAMTRAIRQRILLCEHPVQEVRSLRTELDRLRWIRNLYASTDLQRVLTRIMNTAHVISVIPQTATNLLSDSMQKRIESAQKLNQLLEQDQTARMELARRFRDGSATDAGTIGALLYDDLSNATKTHFERK